MRYLSQDDLMLDISTYTAIGSRKMQEDRIFTHRFDDEFGAPLGCFVAILDGHNGHEAAEGICAMLPHAIPTFAHALTANNLDHERLLAGLCASLHTASAHFVSGTTFAAAFVDLSRKKATVANIGDSIVFHVRNGSLMAKTIAHNARSNRKERMKVVRRGATWREGYLFHQNYGLQCSRSLGDKCIPELLHEPDITTCALAPKDALILATDGVINTSNAHHERAGIREIVTQIGRKGTIAAQDVVLIGMEHCGGKDNATAILLNVM